MQCQCIKKRLAATWAGGFHSFPHGPSHGSALIFSVQTGAEVIALHIDMQKETPVMTTQATGQI
jgi:hypothetical protein